MYIMRLLSFRIKARLSFKRRLAVIAAVPLVITPTASPVAMANAVSGFRIISTVNVGVNPFGATISPDGKTVWVANCGPPDDHIGTSGHTVTVLDAKTYQIRSLINVGVFPEDIAFTRRGRQAFVTNSTDATVSVIQTSTRKVTQTIDLAGIGMAFPFGIVGSKDDRKLFVTTGGGVSPATVAVLDNTNPAKVTIGDTIALPAFTGRPALTPNGKLLIVPRGRADVFTPEVALVDPAGNRVVADLRLDTQGVTESATVTPDGRYAYISIFGGPFGGDGGVWLVDLARRSTVTVIPTPDAEILGVNVSPDGRFVFATDFGLGQVSIISTATQRVVANVPVGTKPNEVAFTPDSKKAFVTNQGDTTVSVLALP
jgi:YVTN family beta-propeller protein